jgi:hypothetical protein
MMMNCREATRLMSEERDRALSVAERAALRYHTMMCKGCSNFREQMAFLSKAARRYREGQDEAKTD